MSLIVWIAAQCAMSSFTQRSLESFPSPKTRPMQSGLPLFVYQSVSMGVWVFASLFVFVQFCCCFFFSWLYLFVSHRFKHKSIFEKATHVLGVVDFLVIKTLAMDWKVDVEDWVEVTSRELNEVRPQLGSRIVSKDVTSSSKLKNSFIVVWLFFVFICFHYLTLLE